MGSVVKRYGFKVEINGVNATDDIRPYLLSIDYNDVTDGQDTATIVLDNRYLEWHKTRPIKRGDKIAIHLGMLPKIERLFGGVVNSVVYSFGKGNTATIECTTVDMAKKEVRQPSNDTYKNNTPNDVVGDLCSQSGLDISQISPTEILAATGNYPGYDESKLQRAQRITKEQIGGSLAFKDGAAKIYDSKKAGAVEQTFTWGTDVELVSVSIGEYREDEPAKEVESTTLDPKIGTGNQGTATVESVSDISNYSHADILAASSNAPTVDKLSGYHDPTAGQLSDTETKNRAGSKSIGRYVVSGNLKLSGADPVRAGIWIELKNVGEYSGKFFVELVKHTAGSDYSQSVSIRERKK